MIRRPLTHGIGLLVLLLAVQVRAEAEYWVVVGSYQNLTYAEEALGQAVQALDASFSMSTVDTAGGRFFRVTGGPYLSREIGEHMIEESRQAGFSSPWLLVTQRDDLLAPSYGSGLSEFDFESPLPDLEEYDIESQQLRVPAVEPADIPGFNAPERPEREQDHQLIDEAPDGYELHRLNRDQSAIDWSSPFLLATTSQQVLAAAATALAEPTPIPDGPIEVDLQQEEPLVLQQWDHESADIQIDGHLKEEAWHHAMAIRQFKVTEPDTLIDPVYVTEVRLFYTNRGVYVSFDMEQPEDTLVQRLSSRDNREVNRDYVSFTLDTSGSARYAYWMTLALGDTQMDGTALPERQFSTNWDGAWWGATTQTERGWSAEFFVPWSQMSMPKQDADGRRRIGFYSSRLVAHRNERWAFPALPRSQPKFMSAFRSLEVSDVNPRQQWSLFPYASSTTDIATDSTRLKAGADLFWRPATNTQLTAAVNPDFGTVEADQVIVNLTAFETFFPEKRLFFIEGREIFETTPRARSWDPVMLLNTRRIGGSPRTPLDESDTDFPIEESGQPTELYGAGKITGQAGSIRYGVLTAFEQDTTLHTADGDSVDASGRDFLIGRMLYENNDGGSYRAVGMMSTLTQHADEDATVAGLDYHYLSQTGAVKLDGQFLYSDLDLTGSGGGGFLDLEYAPRQGMKYVFAYNHFDRKLDLNDAGFLRRNDLTGGRVGTEWIKSGMRSIRDFKIQTFARYEENLDGLAVRSGLGGEGEFTFNNLHALSMGLKYFPARYDDRNSFGNGSYRLDGRPSVDFGYNSDRSRPVSAFASSKFEGDGLDGHVLEGKVGLNWRPIDRLNVEVSTLYRYRDGGWLLHQEDRNMTAFDSEEWQPELSMDFFLSARQELRMKIQWVGIKAFENRFYQVPELPGDLIEVDKPNATPDDFTISSMNFQLRYRWQIAPLSDLYLVYTRNGYDDTPRANFSELFENAWIG
jgi:hypothetical protein